MKKIAFALVGICLAVGLILSATVFFPKFENFGINDAFVTSDVDDDAQNDSGKTDSSDDTQNTDDSDKSQGGNASDDSDISDDPVDPNPDEPNPDNPDDPVNPNPEDPDDSNTEDPDDPKPSDPTDDPDEQPDTVNEYDFMILQNDKVVFDKESKGTIYSGIAGSDFVVYTFKISANYQFEVSYSDNVVVKNSTANNFDKTISFYVSSGTEFCFVLDGNVCKFDCEEYKNFSFAIKLIRGQNATAENGTIWFWDTDILKFQLQIFANGLSYDCNFVADRDFVIGEHCLIFQLEDSCTINFHTTDNKYFFSVNFVKTSN